MLKVTELALKEICSNHLFNEDCLVTTKRFSNNYIDGIITSPPYNINTERSDCYYNNRIF